MIKLNNKGSAISTMLYGILVIIILILYLILSIMSNSLYVKRQIVDDVEKYINKCANKQVAVETCFKTYNFESTPVSCLEEYDSYTACMGYETNNHYSSSTATIKEVVIDYSDIYNSNSNNALIYDEAKTGEVRYVFVGDNPNNYIKIGSKVGRIISIESNGSVRVLMLNPVNTKLDFDSSSELSSENGISAEVVRWKNSAAYNKLNQEYLKLEYKDKMVDSIFNLGSIDPSSTPQSLLEIYTDTAIAKHNSVYGTITIEDYLKASAYAHDNKYNCKVSGSPKLTLSQLNSSTHNCNKRNWLSSQIGGTDKVWTSTPAGSLDSYYILDNAKISTASYNSINKLYLVVNLSSKLTIDTTGTGTASNPYIISLK